MYQKDQDYENKLEGGESRLRRRFCKCRQPHGIKYQKILSCEELKSRIYGVSSFEKSF